MRITRKRARKLHIELWTWLAEHPGENKYTWPGWDKVTAINYCFACEVAGSKTTSVEDNTCLYCPIKSWATKCKKTGDDGGCTGTEYGRWAHSNVAKTRSMLARKIAKMWPKEK